MSHLFFHTGSDMSSLSATSVQKGVHTMKLSEIVRRQEGIMSILSGALVLVLLLGTVPVVSAQADPAKEIADHSCPN